MSQVHYDPAEAIADLNAAVQAAHNGEYETVVERLNDALANLGHICGFCGGPAQRCAERHALGRSCP